MHRFVIVVALFLALAGCTGLGGTHGVPGAGAADRAPDAPLAYLPALKGGYFRSASEATGRNYHVYVRLPEGYDDAPDRSYPVVYVLDGDSLFPLLAPTHLFLVYDETLPEAIVVGIAYGGFDPSVNKRHVDFSAPATDARPGEDGAPRFLDFMKRELIPDVERRYRADPARRVLLGQSRGGYFVLWSALEDPDLFWGRIASNPTFAPGRDRFFAPAGQSSRRDLRVAVASGSRDTVQRRQNALDWAQAWRDRPDAPWRVRLLPIDGGTHAASIGEAYRQAMLWLFDDGNGTAEDPG